MRKSKPTQLAEMLMSHEFVAACLGIDGFPVEMRFAINGG